MIVVPAGHDARRDAGIHRILFAVDGSPASLASVDIGASLATSDTQIGVVCVVGRAVRYSDFVAMTALKDAFVKEGDLAIAAAAGRLESARNVTRRISRPICKYRRQRR
ncbi:hypothetical protein [Caballeronia grimmiae]|uniref:hypothetical protein n=1 Tax=Caballeronia grimmiae TaxID=1071679 RepID=UPI0038B8D512